MNFYINFKSIKICFSSLNYDSDIFLVLKILCSIPMYYSFNVFQDFVGLYCILHLVILHTRHISVAGFFHGNILGDSNKDFFPSL